jgi:hypothetical protein
MKVRAPTVRRAPNPLYTAPQPRSKTASLRRCSKRHVARMRQPRRPCAQSVEPESTAPCARKTQQSRAAIITRPLQSCRQEKAAQGQPRSSLPSFEFQFRVSLFPLSSFHFPIPFSRPLRRCLLLRCFFTLPLCGKLNDYWARFLRSVWRSPRVLEAPAE